MASCGVGVKSYVRGYRKMQVMLYDWRRKVNAEYEESVGYFVQMTKTVNGKNQRWREELAKMKAEYIAELEQNGEADRGCWYDRIEYLEEKLIYLSAIWTMYVKL